MNSGIIVINKPYGYTSRDIVNIFCKKLQTKKIGHCGTLDPLATGVLILCVNEATKLVSFITDASKVYHVKMILGKQTETGDLDGEFVVNEHVKKSYEEIVDVFNRFPLEYVQEVPIYSAVRVNGKRLYEYARTGLEVELPKREVLLKYLKLIEVDNSHDNTVIEFECEVSKGTYIRSLCLDIAKELGTVSVMSELIRTKQGEYTIDESFLIEDDYEFIDVNSIKLPFKSIVLCDDDFESVRHGRVIKNTYEVSGIVPVYYNNELLAIYEVDGDNLKSKRGIKVWK